MCRFYFSPRATSSIIFRCCCCDACAQTQTLVLPPPPLLLLLSISIEHFRRNGKRNGAGRRHDARNNYYYLLLIIYLDIYYWFGVCGACEIWLRWMDVIESGGVWSELEMISCCELWSHNVIKYMLARRCINRISLEWINYMRLTTPYQTSRNTILFIFFHFVDFYVRRKR